MNIRSLTIGSLLLLTAIFFAVSNLRRYTSTSNTSCKTHHDAYVVKMVTVDSENFNVLIADSPSKWEYGLMNVKSKKDICGHDGMIFKFPIAIPQTFWNKDTLVDLDIYWMKRGEKVGQGKLPAITSSGLTTISSPEAVDAVVEIIK